MKTIFAFAALMLMPGPGTRPLPPRETASAGEEVIVFAGGCFWGVEAVFEHVKGVRSATSGYAGGTTKSPTYEEVSSGTTGHAESVQVVFDPSQVSLQQLLEVFFTVAHDPTQLNRQGPDVGTQYRSAVFYRSAAQQKQVQAYIEKLAATRGLRTIVTQVTELQAFYPAEAYHQGYMARHPYQPYIVINDAPKVAHLKADFPSLYREVPSQP